MSKNTNSEITNICTTEDAFDEFQSQSMYEENEYITLSDIVSSPQSSHDVTETEILDMQGDDIPVPLQGSGQNTKSTSADKGEALEVVPKPNSTSKQNAKKIPKKRGRKKKNELNSSFKNNKNKTSETTSINSCTSTKDTPKGDDLNFENVIEKANKLILPTDTAKEVNQPEKSRKTTSAISSTLKIKNDSVSKTFSKRGRPIKRKNNIEELLDSMIDDENEKVRLSTVDTKSPEGVSLNSSTKKGKKKKVVDIPAISAPLTNYETTLPSGSNDDSEILKNLCEERSLKEITSIVEPQNINVSSKSIESEGNDEEDIPLVALSSKANRNIEESDVNSLELSKKVDKRKSSDSSITSNVKVNSLSEKSPKKRGRPKKNRSGNTAETEIELDLKESPNKNPKVDNNDVIESNTEDVSSAKIEDNQCQIINDEVKLTSRRNSSQIIEDDEITVSESKQEMEGKLQNVNKRSLKRPTMSDFEYNIDSIIKNNDDGDYVDLEQSDNSESPMRQSSRPVRRKAKKVFDYDEGSDEDPFANMEVSNDDAPRRKKGSRYFSDDEYIPGNKRQLSDVSDSEIDEQDFESNVKQKKNKARRLDTRLNKSPKKKSKTTRGKISSIDESSFDKDTSDFDVCLNSSNTKSKDEKLSQSNLSDDKQNTWGEATNEFKNFLAKISQGTDIKIKKADPIDNTKTPLQIPVLDPNEIKKTVDMFSQTDIKTKPVAVQTNTLHDVPMKNQVALTPEQSERACEFLSGIVKTTAELGQLMTQKSEDFIQKKINTKYVTDTFKMDYCVKKSFLLFKLAKHNLVQMEEDLSKHYEEFLKTNDLLKHREEQKVIASSTKSHSDSDCEIVEEPEVKKDKVKPAFNPKTVFLNKELSIKIAKKQFEEPQPKEKMNITGKHTVWINDSIMIKKVKPTQSFLAQDSRNKKPPDIFVTLQMVSDFFETYERQKARSICAPYIGNEWFSRKESYICQYFFNTPSDFSESSQITQNEVGSLAESEPNNLNESEKNNVCPDSLLSICTQVIKKHMLFEHSYEILTHEEKGLCLNSEMNFQKKTHVPRHENDIKYMQNVNIKLVTVSSLETLCFTKIKKLMYDPNENRLNAVAAVSKRNLQNMICIPYKKKLNDNKETKTKNIFYKCEIKPLFSICVELIQKFFKSDNQISNVYIPSTLQNMAFQKSKDLIYNYNLKNSSEIQSEAKYKVKTLVQICIDLTSSILLRTNENITTLPQNDQEDYFLVTSLKKLCLNRVVALLNKNCIDLSFSIPSRTNDNRILRKNNQEYSLSAPSFKKLCLNKVVALLNKDFTDLTSPILSRTNENRILLQNNQEHYFLVPPLKILCLNEVVALLNKDFTYLTPPILYKTNENRISSSHEHENSFIVISLKKLCLKKLLVLINQDLDKRDYDSHIGETLNLQIDNINSVSEDVFLDSESYVEEHNFSDGEVDYDNGLEDSENNWVSQVQMQELRSCLDSTINNESEEILEPELQNDVTLNIKIEPEINDESQSIVNSSSIKMEPLDLDENNFTPLDIITKQEDLVCTTSNTESVPIQNTKSYDVDSFEAFVNSSKMILALSTSENTNEEIFSQSNLRVRRQYEPDLDHGVETYTDTMNLLIPKNVELAKGRLMESSSDEDSAKKLDKKKPEKRKVKPKKTKKDNLQPSKEKHSKNEVAILTRRMKDRIRQEQKKIQSSDSEMEDVALNLRKEKENNKDKKETECNKKSPEKEIQCNDVDSTEQIHENECNNDVKKNTDEPENHFNEIIPEDKNQYLNTDSVQTADPYDRSVSPLVTVDGPIEHIECSPAIPLLENYVQPASDYSENTLNKEEKIVEEKNVPFVERQGWKCYPIDDKDGKIYQYATVLIDKLPEAFVETYFRYQDVTDKANDDVEIDKLIDLNSLNRTFNILSKEKSKPKEKNTKQISNKPAISCPLDKDMLVEVKTEQCDELVPSEDEGENINDAVSVSGQNSENVLAKDSLVNEDSDSEKPKEVPSSDEFNSVELHTEGETHGKIRLKIKLRHNAKSEEKENCNSEGLLLTADKMMNKELTLLHAPIDMKEENQDMKDITMRPTTRNSVKNIIKTQTKDPTKDTKADDDSSSEEEKQWFTTKEKLLKRLQKKQETPNVDDAKRAKIVSEFIEKRGDNMETRQRARPRRRSNKKKLLERRKQMKILSRELFGDDSSHSGKKYSQASVSKGRRNIRKVLDKKSLGRGTVLANMEEFERKRRLSQRQAQLREVLGCEDGVNVVVINDELCLEYDFKEMRPVVTVHAFFTKVMKAHQYEGVKFMWDACFESVSAVASARGSGCILAHCMGLGKTLQVLALLHTVLTHPKVGIRRVLVCCPLSTVLNWVDEINKWIGPVTEQIKVFELSKLKKTYERAYQLEDWYNGGGIFIIGYELFRSLSTLDPLFDNVRPTIINKIRTALLDPGPDIIICDEGHLLKNDCSVLAVAMSRVATKRRIVLTGTPMQNNLREYYCMVNFVKPNLLGTYSEYSNRFENPIMNGQHRDSREEDIKLMKARTHILHKVLEGCLQRQEASVLYPYLPKKYEYTVFITLTKCQWELYYHYLNNYAKETKQNVLKDFHVLQKIWTHPQVLHNFLMKAREDDTKDSKIKAEKIEDDLAHEDLGASEDIKPGATETWWLPYVADQSAATLDSLHSSNKFLVVFRLLDECVELGDKVLIFSTSLYSMDALEYFLRRTKQWSLGRDYYRLDGSVPAEVRQKWCREFNAPNNVTTKLFLISTRAGSLGLNMTAANRVIILDTSWNPAHDIQSIFRVYRFGQKKDCYIYRLVAMGTMEQKIYERSVTKQAVACRVVDEQQIDRHYNMSDLSELYRLDTGGSGVSAGLAVGVRDAALLRVAQADEVAAALHAVHEHDSLLRGSSETGLPEHERAAAWMQFQQEHTTTHTKIQNIEINCPGKIKQYGRKTITKKEEQTPYQTDRSEGIPEEITKKEEKNCSTNIYKDAQPSTSRHIDAIVNPEAEEIMMKKIMSILIRHNFHTTKGPKEISDLVINVKNVVANARTNGFKDVDPLTASIAKVLLETDNVPIPAINNIICEEKNHSSDTESVETIIGIPNDDRTLSAVEKVENTPRLNTYERRQQPPRLNTYERKQQMPHLNTYERKRQRRSSDEEYVPETTRRKKKPNTRKLKQNTVTSSANNNSSSEILLTELQKTNEKQTTELQETNENYKIEVKRTYEKKKKKEEETDLQKAKQIIELRKKNIPVVPDVNITISQMVDNNKNSEQEFKKSNSNSIPIPKTKMTTALPPKESAPALEENTTTVPNSKDDDSILLSDDEAIAETGSVREINVTSENTQESKENEEMITHKRIPLHKSLLTNKNFIKIVAHTYLSGNPMLDEDAAFLAANYSTSKALKEVELTGNDITCGPIYDIAVQVLGNDLLMKLQNIRCNKSAISSIDSEKVTTKTESSTQSTSETVAKVELNKKAASKLEAVSTKVDNTKQKQKDKPAKTNMRKLEVKSMKTNESETDTTVRAQQVVSLISEARPDISTRPLAPSSPDVVPIGIFKGSATIRRSNSSPIHEECILPDDDDIIMTPPNTLPVVKPQNVTMTENSPAVNKPVTESVTTRRNSKLKAVTLNPVISSIATTLNNFELLHTQTSGTSLEPIENNEVQIQETITAHKPNPTISPQSFETICLDSDDEDTSVSNNEPAKEAVKKSIRRDITKTATTKPSTTVNNVVTPSTSQTKLQPDLYNNDVIIVAPTNTPDKKMNLNKAVTRVTVRLPQTSSEEISHAIKNNQPNCKPGDIIKITESGKIEVLRRTEQVPSNIASSGEYKSNPGVDTITGDKAKILFSNTSQLSENKKEVTQPDNTRTSQLKPKSLNTPSVLKNIVHIPASKYDETKMAPKSVGKNTTDTVQTEITKDNTKAKNIILNTPRKTCNKDKKVKTEESTTIAIDLSDSEDSVKVIDLTENIPKKRENDSNKIVVLNDFAVSSKDITNKMGAKVTNVKGKPVASGSGGAQVISTKKKIVKTSAPTTPHKVSPNSNSKRSSPWQETTINKKKKSDISKPMTLQDFNLDDYDDIIELE